MKHALARSVRLAPENQATRNSVSGDEEKLQDSLDSRAAGRGEMRHVESRWDASRTIWGISRQLRWRDPLIELRAPLVGVEDAQQAVGALADDL